MIVTQKYESTGGLAAELGGTPGPQTVGNIPYADAVLGCDGLEIGNRGSEGREDRKGEICGPGAPIAGSCNQGFAGKESSADGVHHAPRKTQATRSVKFCALLTCLLFAPPHRETQGHSGTGKSYSPTTVEEQVTENRRTIQHLQHVVARNDSTIQALLLSENTAPTQQH